MTPDEIRDLRTRLGLSQAQFAARLGVSVNTVARWEQCSRRPGPYALLRLQQLRARPVDELDIDLVLARATADAASQAAMDAVEHAERQDLSPLALALAGSAAIAHAYGETADQWILSKAHLERERLEAAISELIGAGLWPWG